VEYAAELRKYFIDLIKVSFSSTGVVQDEAPAKSDEAMPWELASNIMAEAMKLKKRLEHGG